MKHLRTVDVTMNGDYTTSHDDPSLGTVHFSFGPLPAHIATELLDHLRTTIPGFVRRRATALTAKPCDKDKLQ